MTTAYTTLLGLALPVQGELQGTWGDEVNNYITNYLDAAVAGTQTISGSQTAVTLSKTTGSSLSQAGSGATGSSQYFVINCTGNPAGTLTITAPAASKAYLIINATSTTQDVKIVGAGPTTGVTLVSGERAIVSWNGSDFVKVANFGGVGSFTTISATTGNITTVNSTTVDTTNIEVTNIKAKDGTASASIADSTGVMSLVANPVLSGGTANGVLYLNGSKVATSGSALTFNGSALGVFANSPTFTVYELASGNNNRLVISQPGIVTTYNSTFSSGDAAQAWQIGNAEQMRLTSTGLGIGTSSPGAKLHVDGGSVAPTSGHVARFDTTATTAYSSGGYVGGQLRLNYGNATNAYGGINFSNFGATSQDFFGVVQNSGGVGSFVWQGFNGSAYAERMRLDSSGNLGLGVTPSAWSTLKAMQFPVGSIAAYDGGASNRQINLINNAYYDGANYRYVATDTAQRYTLINGQHQWLTAPSGTAGDAISFTQAMTLDASGNLLLATTSTPAYTSKMRLQGGLEIHASQQLNILPGNTNPYELVNRSNGGFDFYPTGATLGARITSGGDLLVGRTTASAVTPRVDIQAANFGLAINTTNGSTDEAVRFYNNSTAVGTITTTGSATAYNTSSDQRLKTNIVDAPDAAALIDGIQVRSFEWIADNSHQRYGMVAQELMAVVPEAVYAPADPNDMMAVDYSKLVPMLIKEIQSLRARVAALEGKV